MSCAAIIYWPDAPFDENGLFSVCSIITLPAPRINRPPTRRCRGEVAMQHAKTVRMDDWQSPRSIGIEPTLHEVPADPLVHAVMRRDGVSRSALDAVIAQAQRQLSGRLKGMA
jgi:hypothetical protein